MKPPFSFGAAEQQLQSALRTNSPLLAIVCSPARRGPELRAPDVILGVLVHTSGRVIAGGAIGRTLEINSM
jgi:hypothetical protein